MNADLVVFWVLAPIATAAGVAMVLSRNAVHSALYLIVNLFALSVLFLVLGAPFLFVVQVIVYAGAIMVLFLFVIMLLGVDRQVSMVETIRGQRWIAAALGVGLILEVTLAVRLGLGLSHGAVDFEAVNQGGNVQALASVLFGPYFLPFEVTSVLLIVAAVGAMLHGRRRIAEEEVIDLDAEDLGDPATPPTSDGPAPAEPVHAGEPAS